MLAVARLLVKIGLVSLVLDLRSSLEKRCYQVSECSGLVERNARGDWHDLAVVFK
jgi:hypothetical protein